jgi:polysaccharide biosynthesis/export protein
MPTSIVCGTRSTSARIAFASIWLALTATSLAAQSPPIGHEDRQATASRAELETLAGKAELAADAASDPRVRDRKRLEAAGIRERLSEGDFHVGDRIVLHVANDSSLSDTLVVRAGRTLNLPNLTEISLHGVLRSELPSRLSQEIGRYIRNPRVEALALVRLAVIGQVARPGFYAVNSDALITDVIMHAGGPAVNADLNDIVVRRGSRTVWTAGEVSVAKRDGMTLDQLSLRAGDEIVVGEQRRRSVRGGVQVLTGIGALVVGILALSR